MVRTTIMIKYALRPRTLDVRPTGPLPNVGEIRQNSQQVPTRTVYNNINAQRS